MTSLTTTNMNKIEELLVTGNLNQFTNSERVAYVNKVCELTGLNPLTRPFEFMTFQGKMVMYAKKDATDQLRKIHGVSIKITDRTIVEGVLFVTVEATDKTGRADSDMGCINIAGLKGDSLANATMKGLTKAKRRVTLSICGLGMLDESEIEGMEYSLKEGSQLEGKTKEQLEVIDKRLHEKTIEKESIKEDKEEIEKVVTEIKGMMQVIMFGMTDVQEKGKLMFELLGVRSFSDINNKPLAELNSRLKSLVAYNEEMKQKKRQEKPTFTLE